MDAGNEAGKRRFLGLAGISALVGIVSGVASTYDVAKNELGSFCATFNVGWCQPTPIGDVQVPESATISSVAFAPAEQGIAISIEPRLGSDAGQAAALMQNLKGALGPVGAAASGYQIEGVVSDFANIASRRSRFTFSWKIRRGPLEVACKDVPVSYPSNMGTAASQIVSTAISPSIAESVKNQNVRCS